MPYTFKETGESYDQWLARNRKVEILAKEHLPENVADFRRMDMEDLDMLYNDPNTELWGFMNAWNEDQHSMYKHLKEDGVEFRVVQKRGYKVYFNVEEGIIFKVDSGD